MKINKIPQSLSDESKKILLFYGIYDIKSKKLQNNHGFVPNILIIGQNKFNGLYI
jgi:hypothetical protein